MPLVSAVFTEAQCSYRSRSNIGRVGGDSIDEFFREPSPHELNVTSEMRIAEVIEDLQRQTNEVLENWSSTQAPCFESLRTVNALPPKDDSTITLFHGGEMVSSPISLLPSSVVTSSNIMPASRIAQGKKLPTEELPLNERQPSETIEGVTPRPANLPPHKPSFQSFLRRVGATPPPPTPAPSAPIIRDFACPDLEPKQVLQVPQQGAPVATCSLPALLTDPPQTSRSWVSTLAPTVSGSITMSEQSQTFQSTRKARKTYVDPTYSPSVPTVMNVNASKSVKRKPLPRDSPLLLPLTQLPAIPAIAAII